MPTTKINKGIMSLAAVFAVLLLSAIFKSHVWGNLLSPLNAFLAAAVLFAVYFGAREKGSLHLVWFFFGLGCFSWGVADVIWAVLYSHGGDPAGSILTIAFYALTNLFLAVAILYFIIKQVRRWNLIQLAVDACVITLCAVLLLWIVFFRKSDAFFAIIFSDGFFSAASILLNMLILIAMHIWLFSIRSGKIPVFMRMISFGLALYATVDLYYYYLYFFSMYEANTIIDAIYIASLMLLATGAIWRRKEIGSQKYVPQQVNIGTTRNAVLLLIFPLISTIAEGFVWNDILIFITVTALYFAASSYIQNAIRNEELLKREKEINLELEKRVAEQTSVLAFLSNQDTVTKLYNRRYFMNVLDETIHGMSNSEILALLFIDADRFKNINDTYGHQVGDKVLIEMSNRMLEVASDKAVLARLGGDEFVLLMNGCYLREDIEAFTQQIIDTCNEPILVDGHSLHLTISVGVAISPSDTRDSVTLMKYADIAMYQAKAMGYNRYVFFDPFFVEPIRKKNEIEVMLRQSDIEKDFELYYQPQFSIPGKQIIGAEALLRWRNKEHGYIPPNEFIPVAEEIGMIDNIGQWVTDKVYKQADQWNQKYSIQLKIGMNVSPKQFESDAFVGQIKEIMRENHERAGYLDVEITENSVLRDEERIYEIFDLLRQFEITISIDDFGTGFSSINYLRKYPFDRVKIDKSLIDNISNSENDRKIVKAILSLCKSIGIKTIAEGVEVQEQLDVLEELGCEQVQGYLLGRPVTAGVFEERFILKGED